MDDNTFEVRCRNYLLKKLSTLEKNIEKTVEKEKGHRKAQIEKLCKYKDIDEATEAYGYADITDEEYHEIYDILEKGAAFVEFTKTPKAGALEILRELMRRQEREIRDFEWEMKSPKEREQIRKADAEFRAAHGLNQLK